MGLGSGEWYESRFHRKCIDGGHAGIGHRRRAVGNQAFPRRVNKRGAGVEQETSDSKRFATKALLHFRGGGGFLFPLPTNDLPGDHPFRMPTEFGSRAGAIPRARQQAFDCKPFMHFGFYLMIAALVLIGLEAIYSLYQLAAFVL
jgi:hypothetical protein